jgi:uncharacterized membrane protein
MRWRPARERREFVLDWVFLIGVLLKGLDGLVEVLAGVPALFVTPGQLSELARAVTAGELAEDPHDLIANLILRESHTLGAGGLFIGGLYLAVHGAVKVAIVIALVRGSRRVYPWAIAVLTALLVLQIVDLGVSYSTGVLVLSIVDVMIIWLTWREWRHGRTLGDVLRLRIPLLRTLWLHRLR